MATATMVNPGPTTTQPVVPSGNLTPADIQAIVEQLTPIQARFRQASTFLQADLTQGTFSQSAGQYTTSQAGKSVGLAVRLISEWNVTITIANSSTAAAVFSVSPWFPFNLVANTQVSINGGAATFSASGLGTLAQMLRTRVGSNLLTLLGGQGYALFPALARVTLGSNLTATTATATDRYLLGIKSISVAASASSNNTMTVTFYTVENLVMSRDSLLGALPLQNQSTSVAINRQIQSALSGTRNDYAMPFYTAGGTLTFTLTNATVDSTYEFASVPQDPSLYSGIIRNAFEVIEQPSRSLTGTGPKALDYPIPLNKYIIALHTLLVDGNGAVAAMFDQVNGLGNQYVMYNASTVTPTTRHAGRARADYFLTYGDDPLFFPGYRLWDGEDTVDNITESDNMGWLDTYAVADPHLYYDVGTSFTTTGTFAAVREAVVRGAVTQVNG